MALPASAAVKSDIRFELTQIEARDQKYPYLEAFLDLLYSLLKVLVPEELGISHRYSLPRLPLASAQTVLGCFARALLPILKPATRNQTPSKFITHLVFRSPGIEPYINFVIQDVVLRFNSRSYLHKADQWRIAAKALSILFILLQNYTPQASDFENQLFTLRDQKLPRAKPAGYQILKELLTASELLKKLLFIFHEKLSSDSEFIFKKDLGPVNALEKALQILEITLQKQDLFLALNQQSTSPPLLTGVERLILENRFVNLFHALPLLSCCSDGAPPSALLPRSN